VIPLLCIALFAAGAALSWAVMTGRRAALAERLKAAEADSARLSAELAAERAASALLAADKAGLGAQLAGERAGGEARLTELRSAHDRLRGEFSELSAGALKANSEAFIKLAEQSFEKLHASSAGDLTNRQQAIDNLVKPLRESLEKVDAKIAELENKRERAYGALGDQLKSLTDIQVRMSTETTKLSSALSTTRTAGTWGELQLRRVVELAGMTEHCDFEEQRSFSDEAGRNRPDMIVRLPRGISIVVDAKAPTEAYREAAAATDDAVKAAKFREHAAKVRGHVEALSSREYWARIKELSPEFVVLFLPGDSFLSAAIESDPAIMDRAIGQKVLLATPMTLVALLKAVAYGWNQEVMSRGAEEVGRLGRELHDRLATFAAHLSATGKGLTAALKSYNQALGSFEGSLMPGARKLAELGAKGAKELEAPEAVDVEVRLLQGNR
jgi:DNA recombination protein RmuC